MADPYTYTPGRTRSIFDQIPRIAQGVAQAGIKTIAAPAMLIENIRDGVSNVNYAQANADINAIKNNNMPTTKSELTAAYRRGDINAQQYSDTLKKWGQTGTPVQQIREANTEAPKSKTPITDAVRNLDANIEKGFNAWGVPQPETKAEKFAAQASDALGEAIPAVAAAIATGGTSAILSGTAASYTAGAANAFSSDLLAKGDVKSALITGGAEAISEIIGGKTLNKAASSISKIADTAKTAAGGIASKVGGWAVDTVGEGIEEVLSGGIQGIFKGEDYTPEQAKSDFALGATVGGILGGAMNAASNTSATNQTVTGQKFTVTPDANGNSVFSPVLSQEFKVFDNPNANNNAGMTAVPILRQTFRVTQEDTPGSRPEITPLTATRTTEQTRNTSNTSGGVSNSQAISDMFPNTPANNFPGSVFTFKSDGGGNFNRILPGSDSNGGVTPNIGAFTFIGRGGNFTSLNNPDTTQMSARNTQSGVSTSMEQAAAPVLTQTVPETMITPVTSPTFTPISPDIETTILDVDTISPNNVAENNIPSTVNQQQSETNVLNSNQQINASDTTADNTTNEISNIELTGNNIDTTENAGINQLAMGITIPPINLPNIDDILGKINDNANDFDNNYNDIMDRINDFYERQNEKEKEVTTETPTEIPTITVEPTTEEQTVVQTPIVSETRPQTVEEQGVKINNETNTQASSHMQNLSDVRTSTTNNERAAEVWTPLQVQNQLNARDRPTSNQNATLTQGQGADGRIFETSGYNRTFAGLSTY